MALILAVEPDRRQAALVKALAADRLSADLVVEDSAERALRALGSRVPDLVLVSALLSWHDEVMLGDRLRELGHAAAHVQTLTIPILAAPVRPTARKRGVLSALRGSRDSKATTDGCDLEIFAEQIREYLVSAAPQQPAPMIDATPPVPEIEFTPEPLIETFPEPLAPVVLELVVSGMVEPADDGFRLTAPAGLSDAAAAVALAETEGFAPLGEALEAHPLLDFNALPDPVVELLPVVEAALVAAVEPDPLPWVDLPLEELVETPMHLEAMEPPAPDEVWVLEPVAEVAELVAAPLETGPTSVSVGPTSVSPGPTSERKKRKSKPAQDEWGIFDPEQCGFAALIAKLDQITDDDIEIEGAVRVLRSY